MADPIYIDGSRGEGGGQVLRSSLALALVTGRAVTIDRIRAGREKPGLMRQHLTAVKAAVEICGGQAAGAALGSRSVTFEPRPVRPGEYRFDVGGAGSATLVLQTVLPALLIADGPTNLILEGGTHNTWAPPFDFLEKAFLPLINRMAPHVDVELERHGFYPAGGGRFRVHIQPAAALEGFDLCERGAIVECRARMLLANLPEHIGRREIGTIVDKTGWRAKWCSVAAVDSAGPGNAVLLEVASEHVTEVFTAFGQQGVKAERVAADAAKQANEYIAGGVPVGHYLADQLLLPLGISAWQADGESVSSVGGRDPVRQPRQRGGSFRTLPLSLHATTHIDLLREILGLTITADPPDSAGGCLVRVAP
jgi:RNA 3'-terminal phosphate cyclase (ATP)